jgi:hypothetical protein
MSFGSRPPGSELPDLAEIERFALTRLGGDESSGKALNDQQECDGSIDLGSDGSINSYTELASGQLDSWTQRKAIASAYIWIAVLEAVRRR